MKRTKREKRRNHRRHRRHRLTFFQRLLLCIVILLMIAVGLTAAYKAFFAKPILPDNNRNTQEDTVGEKIDYGDGVQPKVTGTRKSQDFYTFLVLGLDTGGGGHTDTMLLASYDVTNQRATVMSIPRDTMVNVPADVKKINSVYPNYGKGEKGMQALYQEISQLVGFAPDYQIVLEWDAVGKIIDAIGGVYFDVPYPMDYHDPAQDLVIEQAPGYRLLDGKDAMQVIRWRKNDEDSPYGYHKGIGDSGRMELQHNFLKAVMSQMLQPENLLNLGKIARVFQDSVETDLSVQNILWFGKQALFGGLSPEKITFLTMPWQEAEAWSKTYHQNLKYVVPIPDQLLEIVNTQLCPFAEELSLEDLDIMSVNPDGSLSSTTGHLEDRKASKKSHKDNSGKAGSPAPQQDSHPAEENISPPPVPPVEEPEQAPEITEPANPGPDREPSPNQVEGENSTANQEEPSPAETEEPFGILVS